MLPAYWLQTIHLFPRYPKGGIPAWCQYWITSGDVTFPNLTFNQKTAINNWWLSIVGAFCVAESGTLNYTTFWAFSGGSYTFDFGGLTGNYPFGNPLPQSQCAVIRRLTATPGPSGRGRGYLCQIPQAACPGGSLDETYRANLETGFNAALAPLTVDGVTFTQALPSYRNVALLPIIAYVVGARLGVVHRRAREPDLSGSPVTPRRWPQ